MSRLDVDFEFKYGRGAGIVCRWRHEFDDGRVTVLLGASGSGKTTLLRCLAGLERPQRGHIRFAETTWFDAARRVELPPERRDVGVLVQDYALFPHLTVEQNIGFAAGAFAAPGTRARVAELLETFKLRGLEHRRPGQLSGGQQQRVAVARAVFRRPRLLLLDEPLSALDGPTREEVREELAALLRSLAIPAYVVTHDRLDALTFADRTVLVDSGRIIQEGLTQEVFNRPATPVAARLVGVDAVIIGRIAAIDEGIATVTAGGREVKVNVHGEVGSEVALCIRAEDVVVARHESHELSSMNRWHAIVRSETADGPFVRVVLDCGFRVAALVTRDAWRRLSLRPGDAAWAIVKAASITALPRT
ncbi:MAG TPA: ABC transporter ATP-binding protein [Vicinamibacterales bacterium]